MLSYKLESYKMTLRQVAAGTGLSPALLSMFRGRKRRLSLANVDRLFEFFNLRLTWRPQSLRNARRIDASVGFIEQFKQVLRICLEEPGFRSHLRSYWADPAAIDRFLEGQGTLDYEITEHLLNILDVTAVDRGARDG